MLDNVRRIDDVEIISRKIYLLEAAEISSVPARPRPFDGEFANIDAM